MIVYNAWNKVCSLFFEDKEDAEKYAASQGAAVGIQVSQIQVIPSSKLPPNQADSVCACPNCGGEITGVGHKCLQCEK